MAGPSEPWPDSIIMINLSNISLFSPVIEKKKSFFYELAISYNMRKDGLPLPYQYK